MCKTIRMYRHGETEWNKQGILQGWLDSPLTELGEKQAMAVQWQPDIVYTSDLGRAIATAQLMFPKQSANQDNRLREIYLGDWQGQEIRKLQTVPAYRCYCEQPDSFIPSSQETFDQVAERMFSFCQSLLDIPQKNIAVVSHGVAIACLHAAIEQLPLLPLWQKEMLAGGDYLLIEYRNEEWYVKK